MEANISSGVVCFFLLIFVSFSHLVDLEVENPWVLPSLAINCSALSSRDVYMSAAFLGILLLFWLSGGLQNSPEGEEAVRASWTPEKLLLFLRGVGWTWRISHYLNVVLYSMAELTGKPTDAIQNELDGNDSLRQDLLSSRRHFLITLIGFSEANLYYSGYPPLAVPHVWIQFVINNSCLD